jgi:glutathione synthase
VPRPATVVTSTRASVEKFSEQHPGKIVIKPAMGSGGRSVQLINPSHRGALHRGFDHARRHGGPVVVQTYLPEARDGEKRLVWACGELLGGYLRKSAPGDFRHNLKQGGRPHACEITQSDEAVARAIGPHLLRHGIALAGLDVIGGNLVEVNTLNPGGIHWADTLGVRPRGEIAHRAIDLLESTAASLK